MEYLIKEKSTVLIFLAVLLFASCQAGNRQEFDRMPGFSLISARELYNGSEKSSIQALEILRKNLTKNFYLPSYDFGHKICLNNTHSKNIQQACHNFYKTNVAYAKRDDLHHILVGINNYSIVLDEERLFYDGIATDRLFSPCSLRDKGKIDRIDPSKLQSIPLNKGKHNFLLRAYHDICLFQDEQSDNFLLKGNEKEIHENLTKVAEAKENGFDFSQKLFARSILVGLYLESRESMLFYRRASHYLYNLHFSKLKDLLNKDDSVNDNSLSNPGFQIVKNIFKINLINPYSGISPYASGGSRKIIKKLIDDSFARLKELERNGRVNNRFATGGKILRAELLRLQGELAFLYKKYLQANVFFERAIDQLPSEEKNYENLILSCSLTGDTAILKKYRKRMKALNLEERWNTHLIARSDETEIYAINKSKLKQKTASTKLVRKILLQMLYHPFLKGQFPANIEIFETDDSNFRVQYKQGRNIIIIGKQFMRELHELVANRHKNPNVDLNSLIAVVLGHELHHIKAGHGRFANGVRNNPERYMIPAYSNDTEFNSIYRETVRSELWQKEFEADEMGVFYAFLAGYRASSILALIESWHEKNPVQPLLPYGHPPNLLRLKLLTKKIKFLQMLAHSYNQSVSIIKKIKYEADKGKNRLRKEEWEKELLLVQKLLERVKLYLPRQPLLEENLSFVRLMRVQIRDPQPEMPLYAFADDEFTFTLPITSGNRFSFYGKTDIETDQLSTDMSKTPLVRYRPSQRQRYQEENIGKELLRKNIKDLKFALIQDPFNYKLQNNLALSHYWIAQLEIKKFLAVGKWPVKKRKIIQHLQVAEKLLSDLLEQDLKESFSVAINLAATKIARYHTTEQLKAQDSQKILDLFLYRPDQQKQRTGLNQDVYIFHSPYHEWLGGKFAIAYLQLLDLSFWEKLMQEDLQDSKFEHLQKLKTLKTNIDTLYTKSRSNSYWDKEIAQIRARISTKITNYEMQTSKKRKEIVSSKESVK